MNGLVSGSNGGLIEAEEETKVTVIEIHWRIRKHFQRYENKDLKMAVFTVLLLNIHEMLIYCGMLCVDTEDVEILWVDS